MSTKGTIFTTETYFGTKYTQLSWLYSVAQNVGWIKTFDTYSCILTSVNLADVPLHSNALMMIGCKNLGEITDLSFLPKFCTIRHRNMYN